MTWRRTGDINLRRRYIGKDEQYVWDTSNVRWLCIFSAFLNGFWLHGKQTMPTYNAMIYNCCKLPASIFEVVFICNKWILNSSWFIQCLICYNHIRTFVVVLRYVVLLCVYKTHSWWIKGSTWLIYLNPMIWISMPNVWFTCDVTILKPLITVMAL